MRIKKIELKNIKSFDGLISADFAPDTSMFAFSGMNGAGKSTFLKMAWLIQKAHFVTCEGDPVRFSELQTETQRYLSTSDSYACLTLIIEETSSDLLNSIDRQEITIKLFQNKSTRLINLEYSNEAKARELWSYTAPSNLILYVDASKGFSEDTLRFDEINIDKNDRNSLALEAICHPEKLFSGIYRQLVKDYVHDRLIPSKPDRLLYYHVASKLFTKLIPNVELKNFSGNFKPNEFVLLGKVSVDKSKSQKPLYDVREFSSGEKALLSTLTFLCISKSVSTLIIDEPENHFHESLLLEFMSVLHKLCEKNGVINWIYSAKDSGKKINPDWVESEYKGHNLNQVIVSTHSKPLIYKFFSIGKNFIINKSIREIAYDDAEVQLREIGLSTTFTKVIFVEGSGDHEALENLVKSKNVKIKPLSGSSAVIETFKRLATIKHYVQDSRFIFLVDSDNKPAAFFEDVRAIDSSFYDSYFIKLDVHEFENLYLDSAIFKEVLDKYAAISGKNQSDLSEEDVKIKLIELAKSSLSQVYKKELSLTFNQIIERHFSDHIWGNKSFIWNESEKIHEKISEVLNQSNTAELNSTLSLATTEMFSNYANIDDELILRRCDGKQVFNRACTFFAEQAGAKKQAFKQAVFATAEKSANSRVSQISTQILASLDKVV